MQFGYAVLQRTESIGIHSLDDEVFFDQAEAAERAQWVSEHLTGSYADAGDTKVEVVGVVLTDDQYADLCEEFDAGLVG